VIVERIVPDELWMLLERVVPPAPTRPQGGGRRQHGDREVLATIVFVASSGYTWQQLPPGFDPSGATADRRFAEWTKARVWVKLHRLALDGWAPALEKWPRKPNRWVHCVSLRSGQSLSGARRNDDDEHTEWGLHLNILQPAENEFNPRIAFDAGAARIYGRVCAAVISSGRKPRRRPVRLARHTASAPRTAVRRGQPRSPTAPSQSALQGRPCR
jgi:transposase